MNLGKFHGAVWAIDQEFEVLGIIALLAKLQASLTQSVAQPNAQTADAFNTDLDEFIAAIEKSPSNEVTPSRRRIFIELGAAGMIGSGLQTRILNIIQENTITPAAALSKIQQLAKEVKVFYDTIHRLAEGLDELEVEFDELDPGEHEIGVSIPEYLLNHSISNVEKELKCINELFNVISEVSIGEPGHFSLRTIGSSELEVFSVTTPVVALCIATAIERIVALYKQHLEIKKLKLEFEHMKMPTKVTKPLDDHIKTMVKSELELISKDLIKDFYKSDDNGRKNELTTHLTKVLGYMAERIDKGATFEVRVGLPKENTTSQEDPTKSDEEKLKELQENERVLVESIKLNEAGRKAGELGPRTEEILMLPEPYTPEQVQEIEKEPTE